MTQRLYLTFLALLLIAGCESLGVATPQTFEERLAYGYSQNAAIRTSAAQALQAKTISKDDAQRVLSTTDIARTGLDAARAAHGAGDVSTAMGRLQMANSLLQSVSTFLQSRGSK